MAETQEVEQTPEELKAAKAKAREERKKRRAAKEAALETALGESKEKHPKIWTKVDDLVNAVQAIPVEEQPETIPLVTKIIRNRLRPGRQAMTREKMEKKLARLMKQQALLYKKMGEEVPKDLVQYLEE